MAPLKIKKVKPITKQTIERCFTGEVTTHYHPEYSAPSEYKELIYSSDLLTRINIWDSDQMQTKLYQTDFTYIEGVLSQKQTLKIEGSITWTTFYYYDNGILINTKTTQNP